MPQPTPDLIEDEEFRDPGPREGRRRDPMRTCVVTREVRSERELLRFVLDPAGTVVPDLKRRLPGRGVWVTARAEMVEQAVRNKRFARGFRAQVEAPAALAEDVGIALRATALGSIGLARKAGCAVTGFAKVDARARAGETACVLHAAEAKADGVGKIAAALRSAVAQGAEASPVWRMFAGSELDLALGGGNVIHAALTRSSQGVRACEAVARLADYLGLSAPDAGTRGTEAGAVGAASHSEAARAAAKDS
ncbi:RNA-binding protein [Tepidamorphus sp. 3E244]|uniref:RNA-binding protein n=1 Tax=Tepidamorphus sp. 3E244 TaxID=3385498 RepID=UPI0038FC37CF